MSAAAAAPASAAPPVNRTMITISIMLATIIQALDGTIANVALPHMQGSLSASQDQITWVLTSFIVAAAIATPLNGWLVDRYGLKKVFLVSVAGFVVASAVGPLVLVAGFGLMAAALRRTPAGVPAVEPVPA